MAFSKFTIENFKSFRDQQSLQFAQPDPALDGSGLTYIVGANNSGKTTIVEGLSVKSAYKIRSSDRSPRADPRFVLYEGTTVKRDCQLIRPESYTIEENPSIGEGERFEIISSRRHWTSQANATLGNVGDSFVRSHEFQNRENTIEVASELKKIEADSAKYAEFIRLVKRIIPEFTKFAVGYEDHEYIEYISGSGDRHKTEMLGDGVITVIRILLQLYVAKSNPLIIDEPELSLHPAAQKKLIKVIAEYSKARQVVISTHSPYFVRWEYLENGAVLNRVVKLDDERSEIHSIHDFSSYRALLSGANWQQPFVLDEVAKEIFFVEDGILFLEGQEDVGLLRNEDGLSGVNIFGYGVRGKDNFKFALELAKDLGFQKVACILDAGTSEAAIKTELESDFPNFKIVQWNKDDIRDKTAATISPKTGYFTDSGAKKPVAELGDFDEKLKGVATYMTN